MRLILASASPRRRELLSAAGFQFDVEVARVDETKSSTESPIGYVERVARAKVEAVRARHPERPIVGADTIVVIDDVVLGKPADARAAGDMLRTLSGRPHDVLTALALGWRGSVETEVDRTTVWMGPLTERDIAWYVASGEPMDKAGAYAIQGFASRFVSRIEGSYTNVVGLPIPTLVRMLKHAGAAP